MRVKRSVDFRKAPKKSSKGKGVVTEPTREEVWVSSKFSKSDLETLVFAGLLRRNPSSNGVLPWVKIVRMKIQAKS